MIVRVNGVDRTITTGKIFISGAWRPLTLAKAYKSGAWRTVGIFVPDLSVSVPDASGSVHAPAYTSATATVSATPEGGRAPYTYAWSVVSTSGATPTIESPTLGTTNLHTNVGPGETVFCTIRVSVTDLNGTVASAECNCTFSNTYGDPL